MIHPVLRLTNVAKSFGAVRALKEVSFELFAGEIHALVGENGAGKSTLIKIITGALQPDDGKIEINGKPIPKLTPASARAAGIAAIYQQPPLFPDLSILENIALTFETPSAARFVRWRERREKAIEFLQRVGADLAPESPVRDLSMPQQQLVEIARALATGSRILLMDEPTASLTAREVDMLFALIRDLRARGVGIIYISHRLEEIFNIADRVTVLRDGESVATRKLSAPVTSTNEPDFPSASTLQRFDASTFVSESQLIHLMVGREVSTIFPPPESIPGRPLLSVRHLTCHASAVQNVNFEIREGEILGLAGLVGAGRTELARVLFGITPANSGVIELDGQALNIRSPQDALEAGIAYVPEDRRRHGVILEMSVAANVTMAILSRLFPRTWMNSAAERTLAADYIRDFEIKAPSSEIPAANLSGGNQQKVALARWLASKPRFLILDEPTQGVDVGAKAEIHKLIRRLAAKGLAVLMISSELPEILGISDRIAIMRGGTITTILERNKADAHTVMTAALGQN
jgi:rhamnose transport system ATP-binding protein